jgi:hypothetical protein
MARADERTASEDGCRRARTISVALQQVFPIFQLGVDKQRAETTAHDFSVSRKLNSMIRNGPASTMEMTAVIKIVRWGTGACVAALALALSCGVVSAQQKAPDAKKAEPAKKAVPAKPACKTLKDEAACKGDATCQWVAASKTKAGKEIKAYCRTAPKPKAEPAKPAAPKAPAAKAPAPKN